MTKVIDKTLEELKKQIFEAGVVGAGGAGFPTFLKLANEIDTVIINAVECEPLLKADKSVLELHFKELEIALNEVLEATGAQRGVFAVKGKNLKYISTISEFKNGQKGRIFIEEIRDIYPAGDEVVLTYEVTKRVVPEATLPKAVGVLVLNAETLLNIYCSIKGIPVTMKYVTIAGEVPNPKTFLVPIGTKVISLLKACGLTDIDNYAFISGGPLMGSLCNIENEYITKTTKGIIVLPESHSLIQKKKIKSNIALKRASSACCQCRMCSDMCPRYLLGHSIEVHKTIRTVANNITSDTSPYFKAQLCCGCGVCDYIACTQDINPRAVCGEVKGQMIKNNLRYTGSNVEAKPRSEREMRLVPSSRIISRCGLNKYNVESQFTLEEINDDFFYIKLKQHVGKPASPIVKAGDIVKKGQLIAKIEISDVGSNIHSSVDGIIREVTNEGILIENANS